ncbi:hypothetical protein L1049_004280 [Liquidambar formosana]|uniref:TRF2/HOY1 PH-like domain-containing protein n=1 Tax=Liquidambar formosana TaxID=63359 RepID=A0AAP0X038_LIQFO
MVQLMNSGKISPESEMGCRKMLPVKLEVGDSLEEQHGPVQKKSKLDSSQQQWNSETNAFPIPPSQYNPLDEPSPLGLRLRKSPSLLDLIQMRLSQENASKVETLSKKDHKGTAVSSTTDKLKASNFPASILKIGTWEYASRYEGDLVAKCYFAKHKLVWEVLDGGLKNKIEIQWSDIMALKANYPEDGPGTLDIVLARQPLFFRETNPQPRKHTLWQATSDFTNGQASIHRVSIFESPDESKCHGFDVKSEEGSAFYGLHDAASPSGAQSSSSSKNQQQDSISGPPDYFSRETPSPTSVRDTHALEKNVSTETEEPKELGRWDQIKMPGLHPSMSMSDLMSHIEQCISERMTSGNSIFSDDELPSKDIMEEITQILFSDSQHTSTSDEQSIMSRVNSLCCLIQKDPMVVQNLQVKGDNALDVPGDGKTGEPKSVSASCESKVAVDLPAPEGESNDVSGCKQAPSMSRKDSVGELLLNLPRIASLPQFLFNISEDLNKKAR